MLIMKPEKLHIALAFLLLHATVIHAADMMLSQEWRREHDTNFTVETVAYFNTDSITGSGTESVQVTEFHLLFKQDGNPRPIGWQTAEIAMASPPWPEKTIIAVYQDGVYQYLISVAHGGNNSVKVIPPAVWNGEWVSLGIYRSNNVLYDAFSSGWHRYWLESSVLEIVPPQPCVQSPAGLVSWWDADSVFGTAAFDIQGGNDGILMNGAATALGKVGDAFSFDGIDDFVRVPDNWNIEITRDMTVDLWAKQAPTGAFQTLVNKGGTVGSDGPSTIIFGITGDGRLFAGFELADGTNVDLFSTSAISNSTDFHHYAYVRSGNTHSLFVDGVLVGTDSFTGSPGSTAGRDFFIGAFNSDYSPTGGTADARDFFNGLIDEVEVFNRALSQAEIQAIVTVGKCKEGPANQPPVADASNTATEVISLNGTDADVTLDGSLSYDLDGDLLTYSWSENGTEIATDEISIVTLPVGEHTIGILVDDGNGGTDYDEVTITVESDRDGDGVLDGEDAFPDDPDEWADADGDGVGDNADQNDESDLRETLVVGGSETGVPNHVDASGLSIQDHINEIEAEDYRNHGQYVSTVAHFVEDLLDAGFITEDEADVMVSCAAQSDIGKKTKGGKKK